MKCDKIKLLLDSMHPKYNLCQIYENIFFIDDDYIYIYIYIYK